MNLDSLRFRTLRLLWTTAHAKINKTLNLLTLLGIVVAAPYLVIANTPIGAYQTGLYILELIAIFLGRRWFSIPPVPAAWLMLLTSAVHIFMLAFQEGGRGQCQCGLDVGVVSPIAAGFRTDRLIDIDGSVDLQCRGSGVVGCSQLHPCVTPARSARASVGHQVHVGGHDSFELSDHYCYHAELGDPCVCATRRPA